MRSEGHAVESVCRVLREQGCQIAARTYRALKTGTRGRSARAESDAHVEAAVRAAAFTVDPAGRRRLAPEGLYGRRKMTAHLRRSGLEVSAGSVHRAMTSVGLAGVRRGRPARTTIPAPGADRSPDLLNRDFTAAAPNRIWVTDFTYVRSWAGFVYVAFIVDVFAQLIVGWHASTTKTVDLVEVPLRMAVWLRDREGRPTVPGQTIHHSDYAEPCVMPRIIGMACAGGGA
jgi:putative transposase